MSLLKSETDIMAKYILENIQWVSYGNLVFFYLFIPI